MPGQMMNWPMKRRGLLTHVHRPVRGINSSLSARLADSNGMLAEGTRPNSSPKI